MNFGALCSTRKEEDPMSGEDTVRYERPVNTGYEYMVQGRHNDVHVYQIVMIHTHSGVAVGVCARRK